MISETCRLQIKPNSCESRSANKSCELFPICSAASKPAKGDLTPAQLNEIHDELKINQIVVALEMIKKFTPQDETPLQSLSNVVSKGIYLIPKTNICLFEGKDGRGITCPNNPGLYPKDHSKAICARCPTSPNTATSTRSSLPDIYVPLRRQIRALQKTS